MKKALQKQWKSILEQLPDIPIIQKGKIKTSMITVPGEKLLKEGHTLDKNKKPINPKALYEVGSKTHHINKTQFFKDCQRRGLTAIQARDLWVEKHLRVTQLLAGDH